MKHLSIFLALLLAVTFSQAQAIDPADKAILMDIYNNTGGANWPYKTNWGTNTYPWQGIEVDGNGRVTFVDLHANNLIGSLPDNINQLSKLQSFKCNNNQLTGSIPSLTGLTDLRVFICSDNQLTGSIPSLTGLTSLVNFECRNNGITGSIPSLTGLTNLQVFYCYNNNLTGEIPPLAGLTNLKDFSCHYNQLTGSIPPLTGLTALESFYCDNNKLTGSTPSFAGLPRFSTFHAYNNMLTGITDFVPPQELYGFVINSNSINYTVFDNLSDAKAFILTDGQDVRYAPQNINPTIKSTGSQLSTNGEEGATPANYTYNWYKGTPGSGTLLKTVIGNNTVPTADLLAAGATGADDVYVTVTHNTYTIAANTDKNLIFTSDVLEKALPVTYDEVTVIFRNGMLLVQFSTLNETKCSHYIIEGSKDGKNFVKLATIQSQSKNGNSNTALKYEAAINLNSGTAYFGFALLGFVGLILIFFNKRKNKWLVTTMLLVAFTGLGVSSCNKQQQEVEANAEAIKYIRIVQVDLDGTESISKVFRIVPE